ncbi:hypothetical protein IAR55_002938 [Kwoniella newhampshirensis]|uniref:Uncharacterized protein n=1 Tax=Kwoniella newhampshirensis TaxID=1651941 RepID=A0AAW0Z043_9TREE
MRSNVLLFLSKEMGKSGKMRNGKRLTTLLGGDPVDRVIRVTLSPDLAADGDGGGLALDGLSVGVNVGDLDLDRGVVLGGDESVCAGRVRRKCETAERICVQTNFDEEF